MFGRYQICLKTARKTHALYVHTNTRFFYRHDRIRFLRKGENDVSNRSFTEMRSAQFMSNYIPRQSYNSRDNHTTVQQYAR
jgi:hypothetical protein